MLMIKKYSAIPFTKSLCAICMLLILQACAVGKSYKEINPERALEDVRKNNGYYSLKSVPSGQSKLVLRSEGAPQPVEFSICNGELPCEPFVNVGSVANSGHGVVFPWIAKLSNKANRVVNYKPFLEQLITPGKFIYVRGFSHWLDRRNPSLFKGVCGPRTSGFIPQQGRAYLIEFVWEGDTCRQVLYDATNPDSPELLSESDASVKAD
jgi:hypothetical protein